MSWLAAIVWRSISTISFFLIFATTCGPLERDLIDFKQFLIRVVVLLSILIVSLIKGDKCDLWG